MRGLGEILSEPVRLPPLHAVLAFPGVPLATKDVFAAFHQNGAHKVAAAPAPSAFPETDGEIAPSTLLEWLARQCNDLEPAAIARLPVIAEVLGVLRAQSGCALARMSGSGSACFAIFASQRSADAAAGALAVRKDWWVEATSLGG
jgi:4-diphosphocytidyl-2-C-methyl-D-erythritol kinase